MDSRNQQSPLSVFKKQLASGDLAARKAKLAGRSRPQLRADFDALMNQRRDEAPVEGDELPDDLR